MAMGPSAVIMDEAQNKFTVLMSERHLYRDAPQALLRVTSEIRNSRRKERKKHSRATPRHNVAGWHGAAKGRGSVPHFGNTGFEESCAIHFDRKVLRGL